MRLKTAIITGFILIHAALPSAARAQYQPIPNYIGIGAGLQFRNDINNHLSGVTPIAPRLVSLPLAQLPTEQDGQLYWCADCHETAPCTAGGAGAPAVGVDGQWSCSAAAPASAFPLASNVSAGGYRIANLAPNITTGDALSQGQSHLNDLVTATAAYSMGGNLLTNLGGASAIGEALSWGQTGATLYGANFINGPVTGVPTATALGQALSWGQNQAQLTANLPATVVSNANNSANNVTTITIPAPATITNGNALVLTGTFNSAAIGSSGPGTITLPSGFALIRNDTTGANLTAIVACKTANNESGSYTLSWVTGTNFSGVITNISGASCTVDASNGVGSATSGTVTATAPALALTEGNDLVLGVASGMGGDGIVANGNYGALVANPSSSFIGTSIYQYTPTALVSQPFTATSSDYVLAQQVALVPSRTLQSAPLVTGQQGAHLQSLTAAVNKVVNVMAPPYNAQCDGNTDDTAAIQQAVYDACGGNPPTFPSNRSHLPAIYIPATDNGCAISKPIRLPCDHLTFYGAGSGSKLDKGFTGPSLIAEGWGANNLTYGPPLVGSTGQSLSTATDNAIIDADRFLNTANINYASRSVNGFDVEFWDEPTNATGGGYMVCGSVDNPGSGSPMICTYLGGGTGGLGATVATTGGNVSLGVGACAAQVNGTAYDIAIDWDKSTYRLFQNGVLCSSVASTNPPVMQPTEELTLPFVGGHQYYPDQGGIMSSPFAGYLDSIRFENMSLHTAAYTPPTAKFTPDGSTTLLINFDASLDGTQAAYFGTGIFNVYLPVLGSGVGSPASTNLNVHDMELCGPSMPGTWGKGDALFANWAVGSLWQNLSCSAGNYVDFDFYNNDYNSTVRGLFSWGGMVNYDFGNAFNSSKALNNYADGASYECVQENGNEFYEDYTECVDRGSLRYYEWVGAALGGGTIKDMFADSEAANANFVAGIAVTQIGLPVTLIHDEPNTRNGSPFFLISPGNASVTLVNPVFDTYGQSVNAADLVKFMSAPSASDAPVTIIGGAPFPSGVPISNYPAFVQLLGSANNTLSSLTLQNAPTLDAGLNHIDVNALADPPAPAISVVGATGSSSYGPYFVVCHDANGGVTNVSPASNTLADGPATLSASDYIQIAWAAESGCASWDVLKGATGTALATGLPGTATSLNDTGQTTTSYVPPARNTTGDVAYGSILVSVGMPYAKIPTTVVNGGRFYCTDCDPPANPPAACTHIGTKTGSWVDGINNQWLCVP